MKWSSQYSDTYVGKANNMRSPSNSCAHYGGIVARFCEHMHLTFEPYKSRPVEAFRARYVAWRRRPIESTRYMLVFFDELPQVALHETYYINCISFPLNEKVQKHKDDRFKRINKKYPRFRPTPTVQRELLRNYRTRMLRNTKAAIQDVWARIEFWHLISVLTTILSLSTGTIMRSMYHFGGEALLAK